MQILHISDTHLGCMQFNLKEREEDVYEAFNEAIDTAIKDKVYAVVHSGDIFHVPRSSGSALHNIALALKRLNEHNIRFFFTLGEHDISRVKDRPLPLIFHRLNMAEYVGDGKAHIHGNLLIIGLHKHRRSEYDTLLNELKRIGDESKAYSSTKKVLVLHQGLYEFHRYAGEFSVNDLPKGFDYYAMGHLHDHACKVFNDIGIVCYPGSIDLTPGEGIRDVKKGFCIVDLSSTEAKVEFVEIRSSRKSMLYEIDYENLDSSIASILNQVKSISNGKKPLVYVKVRSRSSMIDNLRVSSILARLNEYCLHYTWEPVVMNSVQSKVYTQRPDIDKELLSLAENILGDSKSAEFAVHDLLNMLVNDRVDDAIDAVWKRFHDMLKINK